MQTLQRILERIITSLMFSLVLFFFSFSYMTGQFPPRKSDFVKAFTTVKAMLAANKEHSAQAHQLQAIQASGQEINLKQMLEFQKLGVKKIELTIELMDLFKKIELSPANDEMQEKLNRLSSNLELVEKDMTEISKHYQKMNETPASGSAASQ